MKWGLVPLWSLWWWNQCSFQSLWGCYCFTFFQQKFSHLCCWPFSTALTGFSHAFYYFWVPLMGTVSASPSPSLQGAKRGPTWGVWILHCHGQTPCFQLQSQEVWASFHPLCLGRETALDLWLCRGSLAPALTPCVWSPSLVRGISPSLVSHHFGPYLQLRLSAAFLRIAFLGELRHCAFKRLLYCTSVAVSVHAHCPPLSDSSALSTGARTLCPWKLAQREQYTGMWPMTGAGGSRGNPEGNSGSWRRQN